MPAGYNAMRNLDFADTMMRGVNKMDTDYRQAQAQDETSEQRDFLLAGIGAGQPVSSIPAHRQGLLAQALQGIGFLPSQIKASPAEMGLQKAALEDRTMQKLLAASQLAGRISPRGLAEISKLPGMESVLGGLSPEIMSQFQTPLDEKYFQAMLMGQSRQNQQEETKRWHDMELGQQQDRNQIMADNAASRNQLAGLNTSIHEQMMQQGQERLLAQQDAQFNNMVGMRIRATGMNPAAQTEWNALQEDYMNRRGMGEPPRQAAMNAFAAHPTLFGKQAAGAASSGPGISLGDIFKRLMSYSRGGSASGGGVPGPGTAPSGKLPSLPPGWK